MLHPDDLTETIPRTSAVSKNNIPPQAHAAMRIVFTIVNKSSGLKSNSPATTSNRTPRITDISIKKFANAFSFLFLFILLSRPLNNLLIIYYDRFIN